MKKILLKNLDTGKLKEIPAVYKIYAIRRYRSYILKRLLKNDAVGLMYVGETINLQKRLTNFIKEFKNNSHGSKHCAAYKFWKYKNLRKNFPFEKLACTYYYCILKSQAKEREVETIQKYIKEFGEAPPLNAH